jgi:hypothetical protein
MTWCRDDLYIGYTDAAKKDPDYAEYKEKLEHAVRWFYRYNGVLSYAAHITASTYLLVSACQAGLDSNSSYSTLFSILHIGIPIFSTCVIGGTKIAKNNIAITAKDLIKRGVQMGFFKFTPPDIPIEELSDQTSLIINTESHDGKQEIHTDAICHRILGPS